MSGRFYSACFFSGQVQLAQEKLLLSYFMGEEAAMTTRAFTHGYDIFHPAETIVWHDYLRTEARKHWGDHTDANSGASSWSELDQKSRRKVQRLLRGESVESFGLGQVRTLEEYEAYAGLSFVQRKAQLYTLHGGGPPNPVTLPNWTESIYPWIMRVTVQRHQLPEGSLDDPAIWYLGIQDDRGHELCRLDIMPDKLALLCGNEEQIALICEFPSEAIPSTWTVWPLSRSKGWLHRIGG